ncbi:hypothetical protein FPOAC1_012499 [Fusarium poae]|uniref:hypothetical protein n=1 Tax=Fusarium poae TaxID=36050 RepID=UPI001CEB1016|nr:hypothetical protein FPOAC1_012499 [Fusarium poae]KAG8667666.1 hypothetical protein FPOAC1_012499 [Fusarium poae]
MDESLVLALSLAEAVEADAALIEQLLQEDQLAREHMIAEALAEGRWAPVEPSANQPQLDEETYTRLRLLNVVPTNRSDTEDAENRTQQDPSVSDTQNTQAAVHTDDIQEDTNNNTAGDNQAVDEQQTEPANNQPASYEEEEVENDQDKDNAGDSLHTLETPHAPASSLAIVPIADMRQCISCQEDFPDAQTFHAPCSHHWCQPCLVLFIELSLRDESLFPPTCCEPLPVEPGDFISQEIFDKFQEKTIEFSAVDRTYCSNTACSTFILPQSIEGDIGRCPHCENYTCVLCKQPQHLGICREDTEAQNVLRLGEIQGWQTCSECRHLVERTAGCNHISKSNHFMQNTCLTIMMQVALAVISFVTSVVLVGGRAKVPCRAKTSFWMLH